MVPPVQDDIKPECMDFHGKGSLSLTHASLAPLYHSKMYKVLIDCMVETIDKVPLSLSLRRRRSSQVPSSSPWSTFQKMFSTTFWYDEEWSECSSTVDKADQTGRTSSPSSTVSFSPSSSASGSSCAIVTNKKGEEGQFSARWSSALSTSPAVNLPSTANVSAEAKG